jgi:hypothetical protein
MANHTKTSNKSNSRAKKQLAWEKYKPLVHAVWYWFGLPSLLYLCFFFLFQPHYLGNFSDGFYLDSGDGFQNVWNIWWVNESLVQQGTSPYFTNVVHWPHGVTLVPQTMNIFNGLMAIPLINIFGFSLIEATNFAVVFSFVFGGTAMFWFIKKLVGGYWVPIVAGGLFTFSTYHFAHAIGHLQLVSFEFIPLFFLAFWTLLEKMRYRYAVLASLALFLVLLCDYYYLFWCVIVGAMWVAWKLYRRELKLDGLTFRVLGVFASLSSLLIGPLAIALMRLSKHDPLLGSHDPVAFSLDPTAIFIPGGSWYWSSLTSWHWTHLPFVSESSIYFGMGLLAVLFIAFLDLIKQHRKKVKRKVPTWINFWWVVLFVFGILALGPRFRMMGNTIESVPMPYAFLEAIFPTLEISGMPVRWILVSLIAAIVIASYYLNKLNLTARKGRVLFGIFIFVSLLDLWPIRLPLTMPEQHTQPYVYALRDLPDGAVIDNGAVSGGEQLFHQTIHEKPMAFGYVTRVPESVDKKDFLIFAALEEGRHEQLCKDFGVRYVTTPSFRPLQTPFPKIYDDGDRLIYDLKNSENC